MENLFVPFCQHMILPLYYATASRKPLTEGAQQAIFKRKQNFTNRL
jgi:hypothetical protein